jgi:hypothetical protein
MRVPIIVLALMLVCGTIALAADATMPGSSPSGQAMVDQCLSKCLNVSAAQIAQLRSQGLCDSDIAMAAAIAAKACKPLSDVVAQWQSSKDWKQVASSYDLSMADVASAMAAANADSEAFNTAFFAQYYNAPQSQIAQLRRQGHSWDEVNVIANAALQTKQSVTQIASLRGQGMDWASIATRYNVSCDALTTPAKVQCVAVTPPCPAPAPCPTPAGAGPTTVCPPAPCPAPCPTVCPPGPSSCCGTGPCQVCDSCGNVVLNYDQVMDLYAEGRDWLDVAIAARISMICGYPIKQILTDLKSFGTWQRTLPYYAVDASQAYNVADYPFPRRSIYSVGVDAQHMQMLAKYQKPGTWPVCRRGNPPCPGGVGAGVTVVPVPCPNPCGDQPVCPSPPAPIPCPTPSP